MSVQGLTLDTGTEQGQRKHFNLIVIGSGPAGYRAAVQSAKLRKSVCVVEATPDQLGGSWIHTGTIPSKTLRESMDTIHSISFHAGPRWVERIIADLPAERLIEQARKVSDYEEKIVRRYFARYQIDVRHGKGALESPNSVRVIPGSGSPYVLTADYILVATGSSPRRPEDVPFDGWRIVDADEILRLECLPKSMAIYGAGVIGCEYACIFNALGVKTTLVDHRSTIMQYADREISAAMTKLMTQKGIDLALGHKLKSARAEGANAVLELENGQKLVTDVLFFAAGRTPNSRHIGLDRVGIRTQERGEIEVNEHFQTSVPTVYAAGDVIGSPALAATSAAQGRHAACHMFGKRCKSFPKVFPVGVYTIPEISSVGMTEEELKTKNLPYVVGRAHYHEVARGYIRGDEHGLLKLLVCATSHRILGIHIIGHDACNLIHIGLAFMQKNGHAQDFVDMVFNYPTLAEAFRIAAFNALNKIFTEGDIGDPPAEPCEAECTTPGGTCKRKVTGS